MRCTDTDSKGKIVFQTNRGTFFSLNEDEIEDAVDVMMEALYHRRSGKPRRHIDSRHTDK